MCGIFGCICRDESPALDIAQKIKVTRDGTRVSATWPRTYSNPHHVHALDHGHTRDTPSAARLIAVLTGALPCAARPISVLTGALPCAARPNTVLTGAPPWEAWSRRSWCTLPWSGRGHDDAPGRLGPAHAGSADRTAPGQQQWRCLAVEWGGVCRDKGA